MARSETLIITGATGDLTRRFLLPALGALLDSEPERRIELIGAGRRAHPDWLGSVRKAFGGYQGPAIQHTLTHTRWVTADASQTADWRRLLNCSGTPVTVYFALSPRAMRAAAVALQGVPLPPNTRLAVEKPFGQDAASARELNALLLEVVDEEQIFRVDHFLAAPAVLGMPTLRFGNRLLAESWQREQLAEVNIVWDEALGLTGRAGCYDTAGALRDMIQSHLLQVLAATIMPTPAGPEGRPAAMRAALESLRVSRRAGAVRRGRWTAGELAGRPQPAYVDEPGVDPGRRTETLAQVEFVSSLPQWQGVPLRLRSGKGLAENRRYVELVFRSAAPVAGVPARVEPNRLRIQILTGAIQLQLVAADLDGPAELQGVALGAEEHEPTRVIEAAEVAVYARVLRAALSGDPELCVSAAAAVDCWRLTEPISRAFETDEIPLDEYPAGSSGPRHWRAP